nr:DUF262 domain-containing protein [Deltaproteobacteria bacterium]
MTIFKTEALLFVPIFQRPYVWTKPTIDVLFENVEDIDLTRADDTHFVGAVFTSERKAGEAGRAAEYWLIDGQQRITTVYLALLQLALHAVKAHPPEYEPRREFLRMVERYLFERLPSDEFQPRLMPTLRDCRQLRDALQKYESASCPVKLPPDDGPADGYLANAFLHVGKRVGQLTQVDKKFSLSKAQDLFKKLLNKLIVVHISLSESDDPTQIFHTLNATGQKLEIVDLARNDVFKRIKDDPEYSKCRALYDAQWKPLETRFETTDALNKYMFPYALAMSPSAKASKLFPTLRHAWEKMSPEAIIDDLKRHAGVYLSFTKSSPDELESLALPEPLRAQFYRLRRMGSGLPSSTYPFLFNLHHAWRQGALSEALLLRNLQLVESFLIRRFCSGHEPTGLHAIFKKLWQATEGDPAKFLEVIADVKTIYFPDDNEFAHALRTKPLFGRGLTPYMATEYERSRDPDTALPIAEDPSELVVLEHIMPEAEAEGWTLPHEAELPLLLTWGNLALRHIDDASTVGAAPGPKLASSASAPPLPR